MTFTRKLLVFAISLPLLCGVDLSSAFAAHNALNQATLNSSSGLWASQVAAPAGPATSSPFVITWTGSSNRQYSLLAVFNVGSFTLNSGRLSFSSAKANGDTTSPPTLTFELCSGLWDSTTFACSGTITTIGTSTGGLITIPQAILISGRVDVRVTNPHSNGGNYLTTINSVSYRTDIRVGLAINS